jgi:ABC-type methionine transport system ATPase subunit
MTLFAFRNVSKAFRDGLRPRVVLEDVSFEIDEGETIGILASRQAGKTTLFKVAAGIDLPDSGEVLWEGRDLAKMSADTRATYRQLRGIAVASCDWRPLAAEPVITHVAMPLYCCGMKSDQADACAHKALELAKASHTAHRTTDRLGINDRMRVELARALAREPRVLLVDEPALIPQPSDAQEFFELLYDLTKQRRFAMVVASEEVSAVSDSHRVMNLDGQLYSTDSRRKVVEFRRSRGARPNDT